MLATEALRVCLVVARVFEDLNVRYLVGGSIASSLHGHPRATQDADLVADLREEHVDPFVAALEDRFYVDEERVRHAVRRRLPCSGHQPPPREEASSSPTRGSGGNASFHA